MDEARLIEVSGRGSARAWLFVAAHQQNVGSFAHPQRMADEAAELRREITLLRAQVQDLTDVYTGDTQVKHIRGGGSVVACDVTVVVFESLYCFCLLLLLALKREIRAVSVFRSPIVILAIHRRTSCSSRSAGGFYCSCWRE